LRRDGRPSFLAHSTGWPIGSNRPCVLVHPSYPSGHSLTATPADANRLLLMLSLTPGRGPAPWLSNGTRFHRPTCDAGRQRACGRGLLWRALRCSSLRSASPNHAGRTSVRDASGRALLDRGQCVIKKACARFVELCRRLGLLSKASVAIDGSKFKAVNNRDKNFTNGKV
jgi:hypothetical protein